MRNFNKRDEISRRRFISNSAKACLGVSLLPCLQNNSLIAAVSESGKQPKARNVIHLYMAGGMSHIDTFDPKPGTEAQGPVETIKTNADGILIGEYLPLMSKHMDKVAIIRSLNSSQGAHAQGAYFMKTGYIKRGTITHPGMGSWLNKLSGRTNSSIPGNIRINGGNNAPGGAGFFEEKFGPLTIGNPSEGLANSKRNKNIPVKQFETRLNLSEWIDTSFHKEYKYKEVRAYSDAYTEALTLMKSEDLNAFDITKEPKEIKAAYGPSKLGQGCLLARRLIEHDVRYVEVNYGGWDTHNDNFNRIEVQCEALDTALSTLLLDLERRGMLDETLVVVSTEFGRSPEISSDLGRNHHPKVFSCLLAGGGVQGGQVYGASDEIGNEVAENSVSVNDFNATIGYALGLPLEEIVYSPSGRPFTVGNKGKPVTAIF